MGGFGFGGYNGIRCSGIEWDTVRYPVGYSGIQRYTAGYSRILGKYTPEHGSAHSTLQGDTHIYLGPLFFDLRTREIL
jgi:hypothetical protein